MQHYHKNMKTVAWKYKYLLEMVKYRAQNYLMAYLDKTWYD